MQATLQRPQTAEAIRRLADSLLQATAVGDVCSAAVAAVTGALGADRAAILLDSHGELRVAAAHGVSDHFHDAIERLPSSMLDATAVHESLADGGGAVLAVPVCFDGRVLGGIVAIYDQARSFSTDDHSIAGTIAAQVALALLRRHDEDRMSARARQQGMVAELGRLAVSGTPIVELFEHAVQLLPDVMGVKHGVVLELVDGAFRVAASIGCEEAVPGMILPLESGSHAANTVATGAPTIVEDWSGETRFEPNDLQRRNGIRSSVSVILHGSQRPYGVLSACSIARREYTDDEIHFLQSLANVIAARMERRDAEEALLRSETRYRSLVLASSQIVWMTDATGSPPADSVDWTRLTGQSNDEAAGSGWLAAIHPDDRERASEVWTVARDSRSKFDLEVRVSTTDDGYRYCFARGVPVLNTDGSIREWIGTLTDIHERKRSEEALQILSEAGRTLSSSLDYQVTLRSIAETFVPRFADWCIVDSVAENGGIRRIVRYHKDPLKVQLARRIYDLYADQAKENLINTVIDTGKPVLIPRITEEAIRAGAIDEQHREMIAEIAPRSLISVPLHARARLVGVITFVHADSGRRFDATDLALAEQLARRSAVAIENALLFEQTQEANRLKDEFLATLSHELRTPMTAILGWTSFLQLTQERIDAPTFTGALASIERSAKTQSRIIEDLLDISRIVTGKVHLDVSSIELPPLIANAVEALRPAARAKNITIRTSIEGSLPSILGDANRLQQVFWNLMSNAIKFTEPRGTVRIALDSADGQVRASITDTGEGISADFLPYVFERFRQADSSSTRLHGGMGIGLAIVKHLVELHGGRVEARSEGKGKGAEFIVCLPEPRAGAVPDEVQTIAAAPGPPSLSGLRVLIVDDDDESRGFIAMLLTHGGAEVRANDNVLEALQTARTWKPDVILSDIAMPGEDGFEFMSRLRKAGSTVPAIAVTALGGDRDRVLASGFSRYVAKPFDPFHLLSTVAEVTGRT